MSRTDVRSYLGQLARFFGVAEELSLTVLYVWWPVVGQVRASPAGRVLLLRTRAAPGDTVDSGDVVTHEAVHVLSALQPSGAATRLSVQLLDRCTPPPDVRRLQFFEEPLATVLGNIEFRRRFQPKRFSWGRRWYGNEWVDLSARLLYPIVSDALAARRVLDASIMQDAATACAGLVKRTGRS
jgi:hypothetical protein